jgi:hypothetical protein
MRLARTSQRFLFACALGVAALYAPATLGQTSGQRRLEKPLAESLQSAAKDAYTAAGLLNNRGEYAAAATKYEEAYDFSKDPRLLFNIAACERSLRRYARMGAYLRRFKEESGEHISNDDRRIVDDALAALKDYVGSVAVTIDTPGARVSVDGDAAGTTPLSAPLVLDLGKHNISVRADGGKDAEQEVNVTAGSTITVTFTLALPANAANAAVPEKASPEPPPTESMHGRGYGPLVFVGFGLAGVGLLTGSLMGALAISHASSVASACQGTVCPPSIDGDLRDARTFGNVSTIAFAAAGVGAGVGLAALLLSRRPEAPQHAKGSIAPWVTPTGVGVGGSF